MKNNFDMYLNMVINGSEIIVTDNGKVVGRLIPECYAIESITDSLTGVMSGNYDIKDSIEERLREKPEVTESDH